MSRIGRYLEDRADPRGNLLHVAHDRHYRFEMTDGEVLRGALLDIAPDGSSSIRLDDGAVVTRRCEGMLRLTEIERGGPTQPGPTQPGPIQP
jgi:hypothetical protein